MEPGWHTWEKSQEKIFYSLDLHTCALVTHALAMHKATTGSPALLLVLLLLNQHPKKAQSMHPCPCLQRRSNMEPPATSMGNKQLMHFSTSNTYQHLALGNDLA